MVWMFHCSATTACFTPSQASPLEPRLQSIYNAWQEACTDETPAEAIRSNFVECINTVGFRRALRTELAANTHAVWLVGVPAQIKAS